MDLRAFTGLRNDRPVERFEDGDLSVAQNIDIDNSGAVSRRDGYTLRSAGAKHSLWSSDDETLALYVSGTSLVRLNADMSGTVLMTGLTAGLPMAYWKTLDRVYFTNGQQSGVLDNGAVRSWGLAVPSAPAVSVTVGAMPAGKQPWHSSQYPSLPEVYVQNASLEIAWTRVPLEGGTIAGTVLMPFLTRDYEGYDVNSPYALGPGRAPGANRPGPASRLVTHPPYSH